MPIQIKDVFLTSLQIFPDITQPLLYLNTFFSHTFTKVQNTVFFVVLKKYKKSVIKKNQKFNEGPRWRDRQTN